MRKFIVQRLIQLFIVLLGISFVTYSLVYLSPSDPAEIHFMTNDITPTEEALDELREEMGLNEPFLVQYLTWLKDLLVGDLGYSYHFREDVWNVITEKLPLTVLLASVAFIFFVVSSFVLGILSAIYHSRWLDYIIRVLSFMSISVPGFWLGLLLLYVFAVKMQLFPVTYTGEWNNLILPAITLACPLIGKYARLIRSEVLEQYSSDYVIGARMNGTSNWHVMLQYVLPNAIINLVPLLGLSIATLLGGTVIIETIFSWNGIGKMALDAITYRDYDLLQTYVLFMTIIYVVINFIVDVAVRMLDPRLARNEELA